MYPLDSVYGSEAYEVFKRTIGNSHKMPLSFKSKSKKSSETYGDDPIEIVKYTDLVEAVSFLAVMNKRQMLYYRGQAHHLDPIPAIFRPRWRSPSGNEYNITEGMQRQRIYDHLNQRISDIVVCALKKFSVPRPRTLEMFREVIWAVAQHYGLWPTPLVDLTSNLRVAASYALWNKQHEGNLYVVALPASTNSITFEADQHVVLARLQSVCPPIAKRPHYQDGFLAGRFPFNGPNKNQIDTDPGRFSSLSRRLVARIVLKGGNKQGESLDGFWTKDFPPLSKGSLIPKALLADS